MRTPPSETSGPATDRRPDSHWLSREVEALAVAWQRGERPTAATILERHPGIEPEAAVRLIYEEVCLRRDSGENVLSDEVLRQFPQWETELEILLGCDRLLRPVATPLVFPEVGETLGTFRLLAELGRGALGRTYLASEAALADRLVALKVIPDDDEEHLSLARLQHTHIVPLFSEQAFPVQGLRSLCMPYLGGTSLDRILDAIDHIPRERRLGADLVEVIDRAQPFSKGPTIPDGPYRRFLEHATYVKSACWIVACLADALQYAHARGLIHMDVKPSNVLITGDGQPMLLDFHLARGPIRPGEYVVDRLGGTPGWMSPEQRATIEAVRLGENAPESVDYRSDLYALGLLLCKILVGASGVEEAAAGRPWRQRNPEVSVGLSDIVQKCLAPRAADRYPDAAGLSDDLRRHLNDQPLRLVPNRSPFERWRKWQRRGSLARGAAWLSALGAAVVAAALAGAYYSQRVGEIEAALEDGRRLRDEGHYPDAIRTLKRGLDRARGVPAVSQLTRALDDQLRLGATGPEAVELNRLADLIRFHYGIDPPAGEDARALLRHCRAVWDERAGLLQPGGGPSDDETERGIKTDLLELAAVWADLLVRLAPEDQADQARQEALQLLEEAEAAFRPQPFRAARAPEARPALGQPGRIRDAPVTAPSTAWDHYDLGRSYLRSGQTEDAYEEFRRTLELRPQDFWPNFYQGLCAYRLGRYADAVAAFRTCIALSPNAAECYYNRARSAEALGHPDPAFRDYSRALELDPSLTAAALNRGILSFRQQHYDDALADFDRALRHTSDPNTLGRIHYNMALVHPRRGRRPGDEALSRLEKARDLGSREARDLLNRIGQGT